MAKGSSFMTLFDVSRYLDALKNRVTLLLGKALLTAVESVSGHAVIVDLVGRYGENISNAEYYQSYGVETYPLGPDWRSDASISAAAECLVGLIGGDRDHPIVIKVHDRRYRPTNLAPGEVMVYTHENTGDGASGCRIHFKKNREIDIHAKTVNVTCTDAVVDATNKAEVKGGEVHLGDTITIGVNGNRVARIGDRVNVTFGSSAGLHPIVEGSKVVLAED